VEGVLMFPLGLWLLRTEKRIDGTLIAIYLAGGLFAIVNTVQVLVSGVFRAGMTWVLNHPDWPVEAANEAGATMVILWALILADHHYRPKFRTFPMLAVVLFMLFLTQSRSGLLALLTFTVLSLRQLKWQYLVAVGAILPIILRFVPEDYFTRLGKSVTMEKGSFELYTMLIRVYGYQSAVRVFSDHWLFGVGYLSCQYVSHRYNDLKIIDLGAENFYLETAAGLGVVGLAAVAFWYVRLFQLGRTVLEHTPKGTRGHTLAQVHLPLMAALSVANLTGDNFMGLIGAGQLALWGALLTRTGHMAVEQGPPAGGTAERPES
jgi:O-antigen ligase